jgi:hypothetical protein
MVYGGWISSGVLLAGYIIVSRIRSKELLAGWFLVSSWLDIL